MSSEDIKPGYKRTEVGVIPESWSVRSLGELCDYQNGTALEAYFNRRDGFKVISIGNYGVNGQFVETGNYIAFENRNLIEKFVLQNKDLAMSLNDKTAVGAIIGRVLLIEADDSYVFNQRTMRLRPKLFVSSSYLHHAINSNHIHASIVGLAKPGTQIYVNTDDVLNLRISIPDMDEQRAIATALSDVDALLAKLDQLIAKKRDLKQATMQQLLTGQTRLPGFSGAWEVKRLRDVAELSPGINKPVSEMGSGVLYVTVQDLYNGTSIRIEGLGRIRLSEAELQSQALLEGDIVFGKSSVKRDGIGYPSIFLGALEPVVCTGFAYRARALPSQADARFLFYSLRCEPTRRWVIDNSQASALTNINKAIADAIPVSLPSVEEQTTIATVLSDMDTELAALETRRDKTRALKQGMMQELLTGRIRLISLGGKS